MNRKLLVGWIAGGLMIAAASFTLLAKNGPQQNRAGSGYGGPPANQEERATRQAACLKANGGVCPNGGPRQEFRGQGMCRGKEQGAGFGWRHGLRDGTGPRSANGTCPLAKPAQAPQSQPAK